MIDDDILYYLYNNSKDGNAVMLNDWIKKRVSSTLHLEPNHPDRETVTWIKYVLLQMHKKETIYFLNSFTAGIPTPQYSFENRPVEDQLKMLDDAPFNIQLKEKGKKLIREEKTYRISFWANRTAIINAFFSGIIALVLLGLQIKSCRKEDAQEAQSTHEKTKQDSIRRQDTQHREKYETDIQNKIRAIEDSLKIAH
ncbi:MAG TPA: hypothetical protein VL307_12865 [Chitinophagaceae bacterium]|jgi:hypothetical protein|nr:hypothetical protein [Chitinophagaceae bacterium]